MRSFFIAKISCCLLIQNIEYVQKEKSFKTSQEQLNFSNIQVQQKLIIAKNSNLKSQQLKG